MMYESNYLMHYRTKGSKNGVRRYQNEDGTLTAEGREHYGIGEARGRTGQVSLTSSSSHNYKVRKYGKASTGMLEKKPQELSKKELQTRKTRAKRLLKTAALVGVGVAIGYGAHRYNKTTDNLIQTAKNQVHERYKSTESLNKTAQDRAKHAMWRQHDIQAVNSRYAAKKVLNLKGSKATRQFIKDNNLATRKTSEIMERRTGKLVEGYQRSKMTGKFEPYSERKRRRYAERAARSMKHI